MDLAGVIDTVRVCGLGGAVALLVALFEYMLLIGIGRTTSAALKELLDVADSEPKQTECSIAYAVSRHHNGFVGLTLLAYVFAICVSQGSGMLTAPAKEPGLWGVLFVLTVVFLVLIGLTAPRILQAEARRHAACLVAGFPQLNPKGFGHNYRHGARFFVAITGFVLFPLAFYLHMR